MPKSRKRTPGKKSPSPSRQPAQIFHPITMLPTFQDLIDGMVEDDAPLLVNLREAREKPWVMDDETVGRTIRLYRERLGFIPMHRAQLAAWSDDPANAPLLPELERLKGQLPKMEANAREILALANEIKKGTIEKMLAKSDVEVGLEALLRGRLF